MNTCRFYAHPSIPQLRPDRIKAWARVGAHGTSPLTPSAQPGAFQSNSNSESVLPTANEHGPSGIRARRPNMVAAFFLAIWGILTSSAINVLLVFVPVGIVVHAVGLSAGMVFAMNAMAIIPLAALLSYATESIAHRLGYTWGALLNVTFGNAVEFIIFSLALTKNHIRIVQAAIVGSLLATLVLILGMCFLWGGLRFREQVYNSTVTRMSASLLSLSVVSLMLPTAFHASFANMSMADKGVLKLSRGTSVILLLVYILYLIFQLKSHAYLYQATPQHVIERVSTPGPAAQYFNLRRIGAGQSNTTRQSQPSSPIQEGAVGSTAAAPDPSMQPARQEGPLLLRSFGVPPPNPYSSAPPTATTAAADLLPRSILPHHPHQPTRFRVVTRNPVPPFVPPFVPIPFDDSPPNEDDDSMTGENEPTAPRPSLTISILLLFTCTCLIALCAEFMVSSIDGLLAPSSSSSVALSEAFIGLILLPIIGNAAEQVTAVRVVLQNKMDLALAVALGSTIQIALLVTPVVVMMGWGMGKEMSLFFTLFETVCVFASVFVVQFLVLDGRSNYLEGALLLSAYVIIALGAFFYPGVREASMVGDGIET
ncbi:Sodium/calcium exchanger protein-domain-containing protein [Lasiosphaeris hirsuta]|uniref:Sodium/calcium exchanger protein-domain-containing protein n=1 Tax=Lasiosphaeris hirsuta TaxID=260670 RepID=A0AA40BBA6_9PEZI|nr:Sodium/calcium exchanger protein-domain-containing protein [Lasiosphaeris hirsuta]